MSASVVFEKSVGFDEKTGPWEGGKVGFSIRDRVFWLESYFFPGTPNAAYVNAVAEAEDIVRSLNSDMFNGSSL